MSNTLKIDQVVEGIRSNAYVLPAIQREFVWDSKQIRLLFDSLVKDYPIGSFLFWKIKADQVHTFRYYDFITHYHEKDRWYADEHVPQQDKDIIGILDGQQRLTAINIGLMGSLAERKAHGRRDNPLAYPTKHLYLNLEDVDTRSGFTDGLDFRFLTPEESEVSDGKPNFEYRVKNVLNIEDGGPELLNELKNDYRLDDAQAAIAYTRVWNLWTAIRHKERILNESIENKGSEEVLESFVRLNSSGVKLSNADFLLSMAVNQWRNRNAREEVRGLVEQLNDIGRAGFNFNKSLVLKTGLAIIGTDVAFKMDNFNANNMTAMEEKWISIDRSLRLAVQLLDQFGFSEKTLLSTDAVVVPLAVYIHHGSHNEQILTGGAHQESRKLMRKYVLRAEIKQNYWGRGLDRKLKLIRDTIVAQEADAAFPYGAIDSMLEADGIPLRFAQDDLEEVQDLEYGKARTFAILALLFDHIDLNQIFHQDHVFPAEKLKNTALMEAGLGPEEIGQIESRANGLANLQLLQGPINQAKRDTLPLEWLNADGVFENGGLRKQYIAQNRLGDLPASVSEFVEWFDARSARLQDAVNELLAE